MHNASIYTRLFLLLYQIVYYLVYRPGTVQATLQQK